MQPARVSSHRRGNHKPAISDVKPSRSIAKSFDAESGQIYQEVEVVFNKKHSSNWIGELKTPEIVKRLKPAGTGSPSLLEMAKNKCVGEFHDFTPQHFEVIPWSLASDMWNKIVSIHAESFHIWRTLATVYNRPSEFGQPNYRYHLEIRQPPLPSQDYFRGLASSDIRWLSALRISPKQIPVPDLVAIANIPNLTVLDLSDGQTLTDTIPARFDERVMRSWAEMTLSGKAFRRLKVLMLGWQDSVTDWIFKLSVHFPNLQHIIVTDCKHMHQKNRFEWEENAKLYGWSAHHAKKSVKLLRPMLDDKAFRVASISRLYYYTQSEYDSSGSPKDTLKPGTLPVVECWLGTPRPWTHIIDEFPGTRTIWFEKVVTNSGLILTEPETIKRVREVVSSPQASLSPPRKKSHDVKSGRFKPSSKTAANLLAEMGM